MIRALDTDATQAYRDPGPWGDAMPSDPVPTEPASEPASAKPQPPSSDAPPDVQREGGPAERLRQFEQERGLEREDGSGAPYPTDDDGRIIDDHEVTSDADDAYDAGAADAADDDEEEAGGA